MLNAFNIRSQHGVMIRWWDRVWVKEDLKKVAKRKKRDNRSLHSSMNSDVQLCHIQHWPSAAKTPVVASPADVWVKSAKGLLAVTLVAGKHISWQDSTIQVPLLGKYFKVPQYMLDYHSAFISKKQEQICWSGEGTSSFSLCKCKQKKQR